MNSLQLVSLIVFLPALAAILIAFLPTSKPDLIRLVTLVALIACWSRAVDGLAWQRRNAVQVGRSEHAACVFRALDTLV